MCVCVCMWGGGYIAGSVRYACPVNLYSVSGSVSRGVCVNVCVCLYVGWWVYCRKCALCVPCEIIFCPWQCLKRGMRMRQRLCSHSGSNSFILHRTLQHVSTKESCIIPVYHDRAMYIGNTSVKNKCTSAHKQSTL